MDPSPYFIFGSAEADRYVGLFCAVGVSACLIITALISIGFDRLMRCRRAKNRRLHKQ